MWVWLFDFFRSLKGKEWKRPSWGKSRGGRDEMREHPWGWISIPVLEHGQQKPWSLRGGQGFSAESAKHLELLLKGRMKALSIQQTGKLPNKLSNTICIFIFIVAGGVCVFSFGFVFFLIAQKSLEYKCKAMPQKKNSCQQRNSAKKLMKEYIGQLKRQWDAGCQSPKFLFMVSFSVIFSGFHIFKEFSNIILC